MSSSSKRITKLIFLELKEYSEFTTQPPNGIRVSMDDQDIHQWHVVLDGPEGSPYTGGKFRLLLVLPTDYPFKPPKLNFKTKIYHPNVTYDEHGSMCLGMLKGDVWKPSSKLISVLTAAQQLLAEPVPDDAVQTDAAELYQNDRAAFDKKARECTKKHAN